MVKATGPSSTRTSPTVFLSVVITVKVVLFVPQAARLNIMARTSSRESSFFIRDLKIDNASLGQKKLLAEAVPAYEYKEKQRADRWCQRMAQPDGLVEAEFEGLEVRDYVNTGTKI